MDPKILLSEVYAHGASLVVSGERVGIVGKIPNELRESVKKGRPILLPLLQWDEEEAFSIIRKAVARVASNSLEHDLSRAERHAKRSIAKQLVRNHLESHPEALTATQAAVRETLAKEQGHWSERLSTPDLPEEITPEEFISDELLIGSGVRFKEMARRWEEIGGDPNALKRAIENSGYAAFGKERGDFYQTYVYPAKPKTPDTPTNFSKEEERIEKAYADKDMGGLRAALRTWVSRRLEYDEEEENG